jgi:multiple sugar transport system substrate-binding protein
MKVELKASRLLLAVFFTGLLTAGGVFAGGGQEEAEEEVVQEIVFICHQVHRTAIEGVEGATGGRNLAEDFLKEHPNIKSIKFLTATVSDIQDKFFRDAALPTSSLDLGVVNPEWMSPYATGLFLDLNDLMKQAPLEDLEDIAPGLRADMTINGKFLALAMRTGGDVLFFNKEILKDRGIAEDPTVIEEVIPNIRKSAHTRTSGEDVYGFAAQGIKASVYVPCGNFLRAWDGEYVTRDYEAVMTDPRVIRVVKLFADFHKEKVLPPNYTALEIGDAMQLFKDGRLAYNSAPPDYITRYTGEDGLPVENVGFMPFPAAREYKDQYPEAAPVRMFQWAFAIPKGARHPMATWEFVRFISSKEGTKWMAINGNTPVRLSTLDDPSYTSRVPYAGVQKNLFRYGRSMFPGFENWAQARDILGTELHRAILGEKSAEQAMADAQEAIIPLLPQ